MSNVMASKGHLRHSTPREPILKSLASPLSTLVANTFISHTQQHSLQIPKTLTGISDSGDRRFLDSGHLPSNLCQIFPSSNTYGSLLICFLAVSSNSLFWFFRRNTKLSPGKSRRSWAPLVGVWWDFVYARWIRPLGCFGALASSAIS